MSEERREPGGGTIEPLPSGRFSVRARANGKRLRLGTFDTQEEAERRLAAFLVASSEAGAAPSGPLTLRQLGERWLVERAAARKAAGRPESNTERSMWGAHIATAPFIDWPLRDLSFAAVRAWLKTLSVKQARGVVTRGGGVVKFRLLDKCLSRGTVKRTLAILRTCLSDAKADELVTTNAAAGHKLPKKASTEEGWTFLAPAEIDAVTQSPVIPEWARLLYTVAIYTGLRKGELFGLRWEDVDTGAERPQLIVRRSHDGPTKSGRVRRVPLLEPARAALERWRPLCPPTRKGLVFPSSQRQMRGKTDDAGWNDSRFKSGKVVLGHRSRAGIKRHIRFHDLRHTCASHLIMGTWGAAWSLTEIAAMLGHTDTEVTERYAHLSPEHLHAKASETPGPRPRPTPANDTGFSQEIAGSEPFIRGGPTSRADPASRPHDPASHGPTVGQRRLEWGRVAMGPGTSEAILYHFLETAEADDHGAPPP